MALCTGQSLLRPGRIITVRFEVEVLLKFSGVAIRAIGIPVHALVRPVAPFARKTILALVNIVPTVFFDIVGGTDGLKFVSR